MVENSFEGYINLFIFYIIFHQLCNLYGTKHNCPSKNGCLGSTWWAWNWASLPPMGLRTLGSILGIIIPALDPSLLG